MIPWQGHVHLLQQASPPLQPSAADLEFIQHWIDRQSALLAMRGETALRVLILGATRQYHDLRWPPQTRLLAVDYAQAILDSVWPGPVDTTLCTNWLALTPAHGRFHLVLGDGCLCQLNWPEQHTALVKMLHRVLLPAALVLTRAFVLAERNENFAEALQAQQSAKHASTSQVKLRFWLAAQPSPETGIQPRACWQQLQASVPNQQQLAAALGLCAADVQLLVDQYQQSDERRFHYATQAMITDLFCRQPGGFHLEAEYFPSYPLGQHCPSFALRYKG